MAREVEQLRKATKELGVRLSLAQQWVEFLTFAYDQLLYHRVNYRTVPEYRAATSLIADAHDLPITVAESRIAQFLGAATRGVVAAVRRKDFHVVE